MVVKFTEAKKSKSGKSFGREGYEKVSARDMVGKKFVIVDVDIGDGMFGETATVYLKGKKFFLTSSRVLLDQLKDIIIPYIEKGEEVEASLAYASGKSGRRYLTFV